MPHPTPSRSPAPTDRPFVRERTRSSQVRSEGLAVSHVDAVQQIGLMDHRVAPPKSVPVAESEGPLYGHWIPLEMMRNEKDPRRIRPTNSLVHLPPITAQLQSYIKENIFSCHRQMRVSRWFSRLPLTTCNRMWQMDVVQKK